MERSDVVGCGVDELSDARRIIHRFVLQGGETVVEHRVGDVQLVVLIFSTMQIIFGHLDVHCLVLSHIYAFSQSLQNLLYHLVELREELRVAHLICILRIPEQVDALKFAFFILAAQQHLVDAVDFIHCITVAQNVTIVKQIICQRQLEQEDDEQDDGHRLGVF